MSTLLSSSSFTVYQSYSHCHIFMFFFFNDTSTTEIYTLSLHDALPICQHRLSLEVARIFNTCGPRMHPDWENGGRSEEHTSELQSLRHLVCRLLLEKKKKKTRKR